VLLAITALCILTGCGASSNSGTELHRAVVGLKAVISAYDRSSQADVAATASNCRKAYLALAAYSTLRNPNSGSESLDAALKSAYTEALAGFSDCAGAAPYDYQRMLRAQDEMTTANAWIARARSAG
jgi:hypothetical protein